MLLAKNLVWFSRVCSKDPSSTPLDRKFLVWSLCIGEVELNTCIPHPNMWHFPSREKENDKPTQRSFTIKILNLTWGRVLALSKSKLLAISHTSSCGFKVRHQTGKKHGKHLHPSRSALWRSHHPDVVFAHLNNQEMPSFFGGLELGFQRERYQPPCCRSCWWSQWMWTCPERGSLQDCFAHNNKDDENSSGFPNYSK